MFARSAHRPAPSASGFTLVEILIAMTILGLVLVAVTAVLRTSIRTWRTGHDMNEIVQTARITQDVVMRDMNNMTYLRQQLYNQGFQGALFQAARLYEPDLIENGVIELDERFEFENVTPPIDLSFRIGDGGDSDQFTFVRSHVPRYDGDPMTWGLRRIKYYVQDKTLYREEEDPFGYRPGQLDDSFYNASEAAAVLAERFMKQDGYDYLGYGEEPVEALPPELRMLPEEYSMAEPLCEGVEVFDVTGAYFKEGEWHEVRNWDSSSRQYRRPPTLDPIEDEERFRSVMQSMPQLLLEVDGVPTLLQDRGQPDNLPGYIVVKLGVRGPRGVGRVHQFTFFHTLPLAEERDILVRTEEEIEAGYFPPIDLNTMRFHREP